MATTGPVRLLQKFQNRRPTERHELWRNPGDRGKGDNKIKQFAGMPLSWIPTTWIYKGGDLRLRIETTAKSIFECAPTIPPKTANRNGPHKRRATTDSLPIKNFAMLENSNCSPDPVPRVRPQILSTNRGYATGGDHTARHRFRVSFFSSLRIRIQGDQSRTGSLSSMIEAAEGRGGRLRPGGNGPSEATAGKHSVWGLALVCRREKATASCSVISRIKCPQEKKILARVKALGGWKVRITRSDVTRGHPEYYQDCGSATRRRKSPGRVST